MGTLSQEPVTVCYKLVSGIPILLDVRLYLPPLQATQGARRKFYHLLSPRRAFCWEEEELLPYLATLSVLFMPSEIKVHTLMVI